MKKKLVSVMLVAAMAVSLTACGSSAAKEEAAPAAEKEETATEEVKEEAATEETKEEAAVKEGETPKIAFVGKVEGQAWWDHVKSNVNAWAEKNGVDVTYQAPAEVDAAAQVQIMTDLVNQGEIDALLFSANDPDACEAICKQARDKGIIVIATESSGMQNIDYDVEAFDEKGLGSFLMDELAAQMGEEGEYVTMVGSLTMASQNNWADAAIARADEAYPKMTYLNERVVDDSDADVAYNKTKELIQKYPNLKGILGTGSFDAPGCARAIKEMGLTGQVFAISVAMPSEVADYIADGTLQSVALWDAGITAEAMLELACQAYQGTAYADGDKDINLVSDGYTACYGAANEQGAVVIVGDGQIAINKDNIDYWLEVGL